MHSLKSYDKLIEKIIEENGDKSFEELDIIISIKMLEVMSHTLFPGNLIKFHQNIKEVTAKKIHLCYISSSIIAKNQEYCIYNPLLENLTTNSVYVLKRPIITEIGYKYYLPSNIAEFEQFDLALKNYEVDSKIYPFEFEEAARNIGEGFTLKKIR